MKNMHSLALKYDAGKLFALDQTLLPHEELWIQCKSPNDMIHLIQRLAIRGAPLIGIAAAIELARYSEELGNNRITTHLPDAARALRAARPTAVNLMSAVDRLVLLKNPNQLTVESVVHDAEKLFEEDVALCEAMAHRGAALIQHGEQILTHCNTGGLATVGVGTALGVIRRAHEQGKKIHVYVDETRPLLQGARLTAWELGKLKIPYTLICDNMAATLMSQGKIQRVFVGADRIATNGDIANKIGTYSLAVLASFHQIPFYVVAPHTTLDLHCHSGKEIPIEQRDSEEVRADKAPKDARVENPAFDVTPRKLISNIILDNKTY